MPLVRIEMIKGHSPEFRRTLLDCVHESLMATLGTEDWDRFQRIVEIEPENFETAPGKTEHFMIIEITLFPGRTPLQKKHLIEHLTSSLVERLQISATDVFIVIHEPANENWGLGGVQRQ